MQGSKVGYCMKELRQYEISLLGLKSDSSELDFEVRDAFWKALDYAEIEKGNVDVSVKVDRSGRDFLMVFKLKGSVQVNCDRCLAAVDVFVESETELLVKLGEETAELDDKVVVVDTSDGSINLAHYIYEFIVLSLPAKVVHEDESCDPEMLSYLVSHEPSDIKESEEIDPRWEQLKKLKNNN